jgi:mannosyltransferase OCH1-like enzyme
MHLLEHHTPALGRETFNDVIYAGVSNDNVKCIKLNKTYHDPIFCARKFKTYPDEFTITLLNDNVLKIRRTDVSVGGWGENLLIDVKYHNSNREPASNIECSCKIPKTIYQTFQTFECCESMYNSVQSWKRMNPEYEHYYFDDEKRIEFIEKYFDNRVVHAYLSLIAGAFKADLWRCCVLYINGGIYVDADMVCIKPLRECISSNDEFIVARDDPMSKSYLFNGFICSIPNHPFLKKQIDAIVNNVESKKICYYLDISGPGLLGKMVNACLNRPVETCYELGENNINNYKFKTLFHDWKTKTIKIGDEFGVPIIITEYEGKQAEMAQIAHTSYYELYQKNIVYKEIPRNIYYTTKDALDINEYMVSSFTTKNKWWKLNYYSDSDINKFMKDNDSIFMNELGTSVYAHYIRLKSGVERSDLWRYCIMFVLGGVYTDADTYCNLALDKWTNYYDLIFGIEAFLHYDIAKTFGMHKVGSRVGDTIISVCNWSFASSPKNQFFAELIKDICLNPIPNDILNNTGPGRFTKHVIQYFAGHDLLQLNSCDVIKNKSILLNINKFGSNQSHSNSYKNYDNNLECTNRNDVYIVHAFDGSWRHSHQNKEIKLYKPKMACVSHNLTIMKKDNGVGFIGVGRADKDTSRTRFMECIGDCRSVLEYQFDNDFNVLCETEKQILDMNKISKFEDFRFFKLNGSNYLSVSYIDENFNTKVAILNDKYAYLGDVNIGVLNKVSFINNKTVIWEKNWLFFEKDAELYFIYSTNPRYILYKCSNFQNLEFTKVIDVDFPINKDVPNDEKYFTSYVGSDVKISTGGSCNPIYITGKNIYIYLIHTKNYNTRSYNHYGVILNNDLMPIELYSNPIFKSSFIKQELFFIMSMLETDTHLIFSGGINDNTNFVWEIGKEKLFKKLKL